MDKKLIHYKLRVICDQLTTKQLLYARRFRDWEEFDRSTEEERLVTRLLELEYFADEIDQNYIPRY